MGKKRILIVSDYYLPHWTGIVKSIHYFTEALQKEFDFTVLTVKNDPSLPKREKISSVIVMREQSFFSMSRLQYSFSLVVTFAKIISSYDLVIISSPCSNIFFLTLIAKIRNIPVLIYHQGDLRLPKGLWNRCIEVIFFIVTYLSFLMADQISTFTLDYATHSPLMKHFLHKCKPLIPPIPTPNKQPLQKKLASKLARFKKQGFKFIGFGGRFVEEKGFDILLKAIPLIIEKQRRVHFVFAGEINISYEKFFQNNNKLFETVKKHITMLGLLNQESLYTFYKSVDCIVVPSRSDCFNLFQAEGMMSGAPSIASNIPGLRYLVQMSKFGALFQSENVEDLANTILNVLNNSKTFKNQFNALQHILDENKLTQDMRTVLNNLTLKRR